MFEQIISESTELQEKVEALRKEHAAKVKPLLQAFIAGNPQVAKVTWKQYTPYFNDGDACTFSVNDPEFYFVNEAGEFDEDDYDGEGFSSWSLDRDEYGPKEHVTDKTRNACRALSHVLGAIPGALEELFGDHCEVVVTADGVEVEEYDHD